MPVTQMTLSLRRTGWARVRLIIVAATTAVAIAVSAVPATASVTAASWPTTAKGWDRDAVTVAAGRSWAVFRRGLVIELRSRPLAGGATRERWRSTLPRSLDGVAGYGPVPDGYVDNGSYRHALVDRVVVEDGRVLVQYSWCLSGEDISNSGLAVCVGTTVAGFRASDGAAGTVVSRPGEQIAGTDPLVLVRPAMPPETAGEFRILRAGEVHPLPAGVSEPSLGVPKTNGGRIIQYRYAPSPESRIVFRDLVVADLQTGMTAYTLGYDQLWASMSRAKPSLSLNARLVPNGELAVGFSTRRRGVQPVFVDASGRIRKVGARMAGASAVLVEPSGVGRRTVVFVYGATRSSGRRRTCEGLWVVDRAGRRGARLRAPSNLVVAGDDAPAFWDGRTLVYGRPISEPSGDRDRAMLVWRGLDRVKLRTSTVPRCSGRQR